MAEPWFFEPGGSLVFVYRARRWDTSPPPFMTNADIVSVAATAVDSQGNPVVVSQQPTYSAPHKGFVGKIGADALLNVGYVTISLVPTVAAGVPPEWAQERVIDVTVDHEDSEGVVLRT